MLRSTRDILWRGVAVAAICLGGVGVLVPVLPTVPFLILAAFAAGKGWPALERRLLEHSRYGAHIRGWREQGTVPRKAKIFATLLMASSIVVLAIAEVPVWLKASVAALLIGVAIWLWTRPEPGL
jgi:uncharacterized membrane protein YbaN (DUF454 family)